MCNMEIYIYGQISLGYNGHFEGACNYLAHSKCIKKTDQRHVVLMNFRDLLEEVWGLVYSAFQ